MAPAPAPEPEPEPEPEPVPRNAFDVLLSQRTQKRMRAQQKPTRVKRTKPGEEQVTQESNKDMNNRLTKESLWKKALVIKCQRRWRNKKPLVGQRLDEIA